MGNERASLAARGVSLSPRGSARDEALRELLRRERSERFAMVMHFTRILGVGLNLPEERLDTLLDLYLLELSQDRYRPSIVMASRAARQARKNKALADHELLEKVNRLTVTDDDLAPISQKKKRPPRRR